MIFKTRPLHSGSLCALRHRKVPRFRGCAASITRLCKGQDLFCCGPRADFRGTLGEVSTKIGHSHGWASGGPARAVVLGRSWLRSQGMGRGGFVSSVKQSSGVRCCSTLTLPDVGTNGRTWGVGAGSGPVARPAPRHTRGGHPPESLGAGRAAASPTGFRMQKGDTLYLYSADVFTLTGQEVENPYSWVITMHIWTRRKWQPLHF